LEPAEPVPHQGASGFTLIELTIVLAVAIPIATGIAMTTQLANGTMEANTRNADVSNYCQRMGQRIARLVRPMQMHTVQAPAVQQDITELRAATLGQWIAPSDLIWRPGLSFQSASGLLSMNAALATSPRRIEFQLEPGEIENDIDDDGDGLIDEGVITLLQNSTTLAILRDVEECNFMLDGRVLRMRLRVARAGRDQRVYRAFLEKRFYLRNN
jgi:hypothetical protein